MTFKDRADIITDLAAVTLGGLGVFAGANINPDSVSMFEPIGGTAPDFTGLNQINPISAIFAALRTTPTKTPLARLCVPASNPSMNWAGPCTIPWIGS